MGGIGVKDNDMYRGQDGKKKKNLHSSYFNYYLYLCR